jgi:galactokinase/mevalonate kinase-like predicted kinase
MFPNMMCDDISHVIDKYKNSACGWKLSGAGGGGYLIFVSQKPMKGAIQIKIRRRAP